MTIESKDYTDRGEIVKYLAEHYQPNNIEIYRTPGTFAHQYLIDNEMTADSLAHDLVEQAKDGSLKCACCMDERIKAESSDEGVVLSSHAACGASGIVADMVSSNAEYAARYAEFIGRTPEEGVAMTEQLVKDLQAGKEGAKDAFGIVWSQALARRANEAGADQDVKFVHKHLGVDAHHHYGALAVVDVSNSLADGTPGDLGERAYFIDNPKGVLKEQSTKTAYDQMVAYGILAAKIARGDHSTVPKDQTFVLAVVHGAEFDGAQWEASWKGAGGQVDAEGNYTLPSDSKLKLEFISSDEIEAVNKR